jgi:ATP-dependent helicase HrpB
VADVDDAGPESRILLAAPVEPSVIAELASSHGVRDTVVRWHDDRRCATVTERMALGAITLAEVQLRSPNPDLLRSAVLDAVRSRGLSLLEWSDSARRVRERLAFLHRIDPQSWPDMSDNALLATLADWLGPHVGDGSVARVDPGDLLVKALPHERRTALPREAPERFEAPTGSKLAIDYSDPASPVLPVKLQEMFGVTVTPTIGRGRVPLAVQLLSPAGRPVQVTRDLAGFWRASYFEVRREMKGRYPKHEWPEDPLSAKPTRRAKPRPKTD